MDIAILTAQGFLSFTPSSDGKTVTVEYRPSQGSWETIALPGLEEAIRAIVREELDAGSGNGGGAPVDDTWPASIVPAPNVAYVQQCKDYLAAIDPDFSGPCGAFRITQMVAYGLRLQGWGNIKSEPPHNNCKNCKVDTIMHSSDGEWVDVVQSAETENIPAWNVGGTGYPKEDFVAPVSPW